MFAVLVAILHLLGTSRGQASAEWPGTAACEPGAGLMCSSTAHIFQGWLQRDGLLSEALASSRTTVFAPSDRAMRLLAALMSERDLLVSMWVGLLPHACCGLFMPQRAPITAGGLRAA